MRDNIPRKACLIKEDLKCRFTKLLKEKNGEANIVSIIFIIIIVIGVALIFRDRLTDLINSLFNQIEEDVKAI